MLAFDSGPDAGLGHQRRMEALASALADAGVACELVVADGPIEADLVVVDSYRHRADTASLFRGRVVVALDDLDRDLAVDVVVDPSPGATSDPHRRAGQVLAGANYALVDSALRTLSPRPVGDSVRTVLVTMGGADPGLGTRIAAELHETLPGVDVRLAIGLWAEGDPPPGVSVVRTVGGLGPELAQADLVVTAGGVTLLEALCLGRPTVAVVVADNQRRAVTAATERGGAMAVSPDDALARAVEVAGDPDGRRRLAAAAVQIVDGRGPTRVAAVLCSFRGLTARAP